MKAITFFAALTLIIGSLTATAPAATAATGDGYPADTESSISDAGTPVHPAATSPSGPVRIW